MMYVGPVLTTTNDLEALDTTLALPAFDTLKVVSGWGYSHGGSTEARAFALAAAPTTIVRTTTGDGCAGHRTIDPAKVLEDVAPFYVLKRRIWIELGYEPNNLVTPLTEAEC